jgi:hydroxymethylbilane synthase
MINRLRIATRRSKLALWQAEHVAARLREAHPQLTVELVPIVTQGDRILDRSLAEIGGKGLFIKELELAIGQGDADIAVHSMKDVPAQLPPDMMLGAFLPRADARDVFVSNRYRSFSQLPSGARVGTSSLRRQCQLKHLNGAIATIDVRGNVDTRLRKLDAGEFDAIVLAGAGLTRLGLADRITEYLDPAVCLPAVGQGIIGIECRLDDLASQQYIAALNDREAQLCITAERAFAYRLEGNCQSPLGAYAVLQGYTIILQGMVASRDARLIQRDQLSGAAASAQDLGSQLALRMLAAGADELLQDSRSAR